MAQQAQDTTHPQVYVDGAYIGEGYTVSHALMVPAEKLATKLGYKLKVDARANTAHLVSDNKTVKMRSHEWLPVEDSKKNVLYRDPVVLEGRVSVELDVKPGLLAGRKGYYPVTFLITGKDASGAIVYRGTITEMYPDQGGRFFLKTDSIPANTEIATFEFVLSDSGSFNQ